MSNVPADYSGKGLDEFILDSKEYAGEITIEVAPENIVAACQTLRDGLGFNYLSDITGIDYYTDEKRFGVAYNICNLDTNSRLRVLVRVDESNPEVPTVVDVWTAANWFEREVFDMVGVTFAGHPDMRRLFMPEDFEYYPIRKEFPLIGIPGSIQMPEKDPPKEYR